MRQIMVLSDGETFTELDGCEIGTVLYDEHEQPVLSQDEWDDLIEKYQSEDRVVGSVWDGSRGVLYEVAKRFEEAA